MEIGNTITFKSGRRDHKGEDGEFDHIGMVTKINRDKDGNILSFDFIHSSSKGVNEQTYNMEKGLAGFKLKGVQAWDTPESKSKNNSKSVHVVKNVMRALSLPFKIIQEAIIKPAQKAKKIIDK